MRKNEHPFAKTLHEFPRWIEFENRRKRRHLSGCAIEATILAAALGNPDGFAVLIDLDRAQRSPGSAFGHLCPVLNRLIRIGSRVCGLDVTLHEQCNRYSEKRDFHDSPRFSSCGLRFAADDHPSREAAVLAPIVVRGPSSLPRPNRSLIRFRDGSQTFI